MKRFSGIAAFALLVAVAAAPGRASAEQQFVIGVSNTHIGNSWREEFVCSIKAEALASGLVSKVILANREAEPSEQIADLRTLISAGVNAIIINPSDEKALSGVIKAAADKGIVAVAADLCSRTRADAFRSFSIACISCMTANVPRTLTMIPNRIAIGWSPRAGLSRPPGRPSFGP